MPTLLRLIFVVGLIVGVVYGGMWALVTYVRPEPHEITQTIPLPKQARP